MSYLTEKSFIRRTFTVFTVGPGILYIISTYTGLWFAVWLLHMVAMFEWTGLKRHLKLCLIDPLIYQQRRALAKQARLSPVRKASPPSSENRKKSKNKAESENQEDEEDAEDDGGPVLLEDLGPWPEAEFPTPVAPRTWFIDAKCIGCSLIVPLTAWRADMLPLGLTAYFFFWVILTLLDNNRVEMKQEIARRKLKLTGRSRSTSAPPRSQQQQQQTKSAQQRDQSLETKPLPDANEFALRELEIVSAYPNIEVFVNFALEYFGFVWISNLAFAVLCLHLGKQGHEMLMLTLVSNWLNDIGALMIGKTLKAVGWQTRPLYPRISPNKSLEGAIGGGVSNALAFVFIGLYVSPNAANGVPEQLKFPIFLTVGALLGCLGVLGDLLQSLFKRVAKIKDTGTVFPGHGGVLDRIDGLVTSFPPVFWFVWAIQRGYFDGWLF